MVVVGLGTKGVEFDWREGGNPVQPPPKGLEPLGDSGWYKSPDNLLPGDPLYCEYNSGSPICGGNPFTSEGLGIEAELNVDPCGVSARLSGSVAFVKVPEVQLTYRAPGECRREYEAPPPVVPPPPIPGVDFVPEKVRPPRGYGDDEYVYVVFTFYYFSATTYYSSRLQTYATAVSFATNSLSGIKHPSTVLYNGYQGNYGELQPASSSCVTERVITYTANKAWVDEGGFPSFTDVSSGLLAIDSRQGYHETNNENVVLGYKVADGSLFAAGQCDLIEGRFGDIFPPGWRDTFSGRDYNDNSKTDSSGQVYEGYVVDTAWMSLAYIGRKPPDKKKRPPPPLPPEKDCCMQCCFSQSPQQQQSNDDACCREALAVVKRIEKNLGVYPGKVTIFDTNEDAFGAQSKVIEFSTVSQGLTRTIERVEKISKIIGIDLLPVTVPKNIVEPINDNFLEEAWDFLTPDATEKINNLFEWHVWNLKQMSTLIGHFQRYVEVEDKEETVTKSDGTQETKTKTKKIPLPDVATSLVESIKNQMVLHREVGLVLDVCMKILVSTCNTKQEVAKVYAEISEIVDFLDYPTNEKSLEVPIQISIPPEGASDEEQQDFYKFLQPGKTIVKYNDWNGQNSFKDYMIHLATLIGRR